MTDDDTAMRFDEWSEAGYRINKGAKSQMRDAAGVPLFTKDQVYKPSKKYWGIHDRAPYEDEKIDHFCSQWDPEHQFLRAIESHCDSVLMKHHPHFFPDEDYL